jgi:UDP-N-acetyl-D-mannosaminuronic acid dehydrogenase
METVVKPILEEASGLKVNEGFYLANGPERVMPGRLLDNNSPTIPLVTWLGVVECRSG